LRSGGRGKRPRFLLARKRRKGVKKTQVPEDNLKEKRGDSPSQKGYQHSGKEAMALGYIVQVVGDKRGPTVGQGQRDKKPPKKKVVQTQKGIKRKGRRGDPGKANDNGRNSKPGETERRQGTTSPKRTALRDKNISNGVHQGKELVA